MSKTKRSLFLPKNIKFTLNPIDERRSTLATSAHHALPVEEYLDEVQLQSYAKTTAKRPLLLLFAWMLSKDKHIEKYRQFWYERGFDVMTVRTSPMDLLLPAVGGARIASTVFDFLTHIQPRYDQVLVHAFSVGGYQLSEFMFKLMGEIKKGDARAELLMKSIQGMIIDSCVFSEDCAPGLSRAITRHPIYQPIIEASISNFLKLTKSFTMDRYLMVSDLLINNKPKING